MPRPNPDRTINVERSLARRIAFERDQRGWNNQSLARRMKAAGCGVHHTAIYKIEKDEQPRGISVNELVAFATVFEVTVEDLLEPVEVVRAGRRVREVFDQWTAALEEAERASRKVDDAGNRIAELIEEVPDARTAVEDAVRAWLNATRGYGVFGFDRRPDIVAEYMSSFEQRRDGDAVLIDQAVVADA